MYNLEFTGAHRAIAAYETNRPNDPLGPVSDAAACLFSEFHRLHILQSEFFTNDSSLTGSAKLSPDPAVKARFDQDLAGTERLAVIGGSSLYVRYSDDPTRNLLDSSDERGYYVNVLKSG